MRLTVTIKSFLLSRWRGDVPLERVFWRDMIIVGTTLNLLTGLAALALLASGEPAALALAVHFGPLPWNVFLFLSVWRAAEKAKPSEALFAKIAVVIWFVAVIVV
jgi:hypothetical protein